MSDALAHQAPARTATVEHLRGATYRLRDPHGDFVCDGPHDFLARICHRNRWHRLDK